MRVKYWNDQKFEKWQDTHFFHDFQRSYFNKEMRSVLSRKKKRRNHFSKSPREKNLLHKTFFLLKEQLLLSRRGDHNSKMAAILMSCSRFFFSCTYYVKHFRSHMPNYWPQRHLLKWFFHRSFQCWFQIPPCYVVPSKINTRLW